MPRPTARPFRPALVGAGAALAGFVIAGTAGLAGPAAATTPVSDPCHVATVSGGQLLADVDVTIPSGRVELRGRIKATKHSGGSFTVAGCTAAGTPLGTASYEIVRAPKTDRFLVRLVGSTVVDAAGVSTNLVTGFPPLTTERAFNAVARGDVRTLTIPGLPGPVSSETSRLPVELLATKAGRHRLTRTSWQAAGAAFLRANGPQPVG